MSSSFCEKKKVLEKKIQTKWANEATFFFMADDNIDWMTFAPMMRFEIRNLRCASKWRIRDFGDSIQIEILNILEKIMKIMVGQIFFNSGSSKFGPLRSFQGFFHVETIALSWILTLPKFTRLWIFHSIFSVWTLGPFSVWCLIGMD